MHNIVQQEFKSLTFIRYKSMGDGKCPQMSDLPAVLEKESLAGWLPTGIAYFTEPSCTWFEVVLMRAKR